MLDLDDVTALANAMPDHLRCLVYVKFWAVLRLGEVVALRREDVDLDAGALRVQRQEVELVGRQQEKLPKTDRTRIVVLPAPVTQALAAHLAIAAGSSLPSRRLFTRADGRPLRGHHVQSAWQTARKAAGLPGVHLHDLRHARLTLAAQRGATTKELMELGGHATPAAALIYQHAAPDRMAELAAGMDPDAERMSRARF